jgi:hypothetical protein
MVADPEVAKRLTYKMINRSVPAQLRLDAQTDVINTAGLAAARCAGLQTAVHWQPPRSIKQGVLIDILLQLPSSFGLMAANSCSHESCHTPVCSLSVQLRPHSCRVAVCCWLQWRAVAHHAACMAACLPVRLTGGLHRPDGRVCCHSGTGEARGRGATCGCSAHVGMCVQS